LAEEHKSKFSLNTVPGKAVRQEGIKKRGKMKDGA
jgi:hypothetical protein